MVSTNLNKTRIKTLISNADQKWFNNNHGKFGYHEHIDFLADYITKNYDSEVVNDDTANDNPPKEPAKPVREPRSSLSRKDFELE